MFGLFITIEGTDGSGKSTQIELLKKYLEEKNFKVIFLREPGGTKIGEKIREIILDIENKEMAYTAEALLYAASRAQLVNEKIIPELENGNIVLCDRFVDSSIVYQGIARDLGKKTIKKINEIATCGLEPDITFFLKISPKEAIERKKEQKELDRLEKEEKYFYNKVYNGYLEIAKKEPERIKIIDATKSVAQVHNSIIKEIEKLFIKGGEIK